MKTRTRSTTTWMTTQRLALAQLAWIAALLGALAACDDGGESSPGAGGSTASSSSGQGGSAGAGGGGGGEGGSAGSGGQGGEPQLALIHHVGRYDTSDPAGPRATWSGSAVLTRLDGTALGVELAGAAGVLFQVVVDGTAAGVFETTGGSQSYQVVADLPAGLHDVEIYRRNEGFFGTVQLLGLSPGAGGSLVESPRPYQHRLEVIGDSITCGYGVEGPDQFCSFSGATESAYATYAAIAARNVNAEAHLIAYSGKGVFQNYGGDTNEPMPELYGRTLTNDPASSWDFASWIADAVVINLGTNDFSAPIAQADFVPAYVALIQQIRAYYPAAMIFCVSWAHWGAAHEQWVLDAMTQSGAANLRHLGFAIDPADGWGCDYHPSLTTHQKLGQQLTEALQTELGW